MAMSELALAPQRNFLSYIVGALSAPRASVRQLAAEAALRALAWQLVVVSAMVSVSATILTDAYSYANQEGETYLLPADYAIADSLLWAAIEFSILLASFPLMRFLWSYLFGFREEARAVWAAAAMLTCPAIILNPLQEFS